MSRRLFIDIDEGQVHCRHTPATRPAGRPPLLLLHASPVSSLLMQRFARQLATDRDVIAFDTLGQGDSAPPRGMDEPVAYFADAALRALARLGGEFARVDVFGTHTGGRIAAEMAILAPNVVRRVVMDGMRRMPAQDYGPYVERVNLAQHIDHDGTQFFKAWNKWRDEYLFTPPFRWTLDQLSGAPLPTPQEMHDAALEVFKSIRYGHVAYQAAIRYRVEERLPLITQPALATCAERDGGFSDLAFVGSLPRRGATMAHRVRVEYATDDDLASFAAALLEWLDGPAASGNP
jgi:pimeloyl-ACP methyl ester carboxylesterase